MKIQTETVRTDGFSMEYFRFGQGKAPLVILPGLSVQSVMLYAPAVADAYRLLTDDFTIYVFDRRAELPASYPIREMARDTQAALRALGLDRVCLFGASQGGMIAMQLAADCPQLVRRLALGSTCCRVTPAQFRTFEKWIGLSKRARTEELYLAFGQVLYPENVFAQMRPMLVEAANAVTREELDRFVILAQSLNGFDITEDIKKIACPALVIGSSDDRVLGAQASVQIAEILTERTDCEMYLYDGYGHAVYDTAPDFTQRLLRFLTKPIGGTDA